MRLPFATAPLPACGFWLAALSVGGGIAAEPPVAGGPEAAVTLAGVTLGERVSGENLSLSDLDHRVVLLAFWTRARKAGEVGLPVLEQAHRSLGPGGLSVVGIHLDRGTTVEVRRAARDLGLTFPIFDGGSVEGIKDGEPPYAVLFDHRGQCLGRGPLEAMAAQAGPAIAAAPPVVLAGRRLTQLASLERLLRDDSKLVAALRKAEGLIESADAATAEEATYVVERLRAQGEAWLARAEALKSSDPPAAAALLQRAATAYRGDEIGRRAADHQRDWKRDKAFSAGLQAASLVAQLEALRGQALTRPGGSRSPAGGQAVAGMKAAAAIPPPLKAQMAQLAALVLELSPDSQAAARAEEIALELGLQATAIP